MFDSFNLKIKLKTIFRLIIFLLMVILIKFEPLNINFNASVNYARNLNNTEVFLYLILGFVSVLMTTFYDFFWFQLNKKKIGLTKILKVSVISNVINNLAGTGGVTGIVIRRLFYQDKDISDGEMHKMNILLLPSFFTGLSGLLVISFFFTMFYETAFKSTILFNVFALLGGAYLILYLFSEYVPFEAIKKKIDQLEFHYSLKIKVFMLFASIIEWLVVVTFIWVIVMQLNKNISYLDVIISYSVAYILGMISFMPAGIIVFDFFMIFSLNRIGMSGFEGTSTVIIFRVFYYIIPFIIANLFFYLEFIFKNKKILKKIEIKSIIGRLKNKINLSPIQLEIISDVSGFLLWIMTLMAGVLLIVSAINPILPKEIQIIESLVSIWVFQLSHFNALFFGILLLALSDEIRLRVREAYYLSMVFLSLGLSFNLIKGFIFKEAFILLSIIVVFALNKKYFYRLFVPFNWSRMIKKVCVAQIVLGLNFFLTPVVDYEIAQMIAISLLVQTSIIALYYVWGAYYSKKPPWRSQTQGSIFQITDDFHKAHFGTVLSHLIYAGDKNIYLTGDKSVLFAFKPLGDKLIVLGDPIGDQNQIENALNEFRKFADIYGYTPIFYQIEEEQLKNYHEIGYTFFKLGEAAKIDLEAFTLETPKMRGFRNTRNRFEREGWTLEMHQPPHNQSLLEELKIISDEWLKNREEKGYSLGRFEENYLNKSPLGVLSNDDQKYAFASLMPAYNNNSIALDLMRFLDASPNSTMEFLLLKLIEWTSENHYKYFDLGMAPLSNVGKSDYASFAEKMASRIFASERFKYNFKGLRQYKDKFRPIWVYKYIAYPVENKIEPIAINISMMIGKSYKEKSKKK